jgi:hypothetical protein
MICLTAKDDHFGTGSNDDQAALRDFTISAFDKTRAILITWMTLYTVPGTEFQQPEMAKAKLTVPT